ncbi:hypothetical protein GQ44DRAFT_727352 [Phaeosphaeriaceae sp. PMI808]|nr:hypothetical protein GQ44DRAFT_727352 [Phaeosphaeriaceae sp. PMI808]
MDFENFSLDLDAEHAFDFSKQFDDTFDDALLDYSAFDNTPPLAIRDQHAIEETEELPQVPVAPIFAQINDRVARVTIQPMEVLLHTHQPAAQEASKLSNTHNSNHILSSPCLPHQTSVEGGPPAATSREPKAKSARSKISSKVKQILKTQFRRHPYLSKNVRVELAKSTGLTERMLQNWFANTRARTDIVAGPEEPPSNTIDLPDCSLDFLDTMRSGNRFTDEPWNAISLLASSNPTTLASSTQSISRENSTKSIASFTSNTPSTLSKRSVDYRGSRQGRRAWKYAPTSDPSFLLSDPALSILSADSGFCSDDAKSFHSKQRVQLPLAKAGQVLKVPRKRYFCTWPNCQKIFHHRFEWERHEEAIHYRPYQWICCDEDAQLVTLKRCGYCLKRDVPLVHGAIESLMNCAKKPAAERTFFRPDQLVPHIKRHVPDIDTQKCISARIPELVAAWKSNNPAMSKCALQCGFCGLIFPTWKERTDHVFKHIQRGISKSSWWPNRLPIVNLAMTTPSSLTCNCCNKIYKDFDTAATHHPICTTWSCRYLPDPHLIFSTHHDDALGYPIATCTLCSIELYGGDEAELAHHADTHELRSCAQTVYTDHAGFAAHLRDGHGADWVFEGRSEAWRGLQGLRRREGVPMIFFLCLDVGLWFLGKRSSMVDQNKTVEKQDMKYLKTWHQLKIFRLFQITARIFQQEMSM